MDKTTKKTDHRKPVVDLVEIARQKRLTAEALEHEAAELERQATMAKGTQRDIKPEELPLIGDEMPTPALMALVQALISDKPCTFQELLHATGARDNRVKGVLMRLQREGHRVINLGTQAKALWFLPSDEAMRRIVATKRDARMKRP